MGLAGIAAGGAAGSVARYLVQVQCAHWFGSRFPYGTLMVNTVGSLLIGVLYIVLLERYAVSAETRLALLTGLLGGFTTFSAFSLETLDLIQRGSFLGAAGNVVLNVALCLAACFLGMTAARSI